MGQLNDRSGNRYLEVGKPASLVKVVNSNLEATLAAKETSFFNNLDSFYDTVAKGLEAIQEQANNGENSMASNLDTNDYAKWNQSIELSSRIVEQNDYLLALFRAGGVSNPDWATMKAELQAFASNASNISSGVLGAAYGGTGRTDGASLDVYVSAYSKKASDLGQIGQFKHIDGTVDPNTLIEPGNYHFSTTIASNGPADFGCYCTVKRFNTDIYQEFQQRAGAQSYWRLSTDGGSTWTDYERREEYVEVANIYISSLGDDKNQGTSSSFPVKTVDRAIRIASRFSTLSYINFRFDSGNWGDVTINIGALKSRYVNILSFDAEQNNSSLPASSPEFNSLVINGNKNWCLLGNINAKSILVRNTIIETVGCFSFGSFSATHQSFISFFNNVIVKSEPTLDCVFSNSNSFILLNGITITFESGATRTNAFLTTGFNSTTYVTGNTYVGSFTGKKYNFAAITSFLASNPSDLPGDINGTGRYIQNALPSDGVIFSNGGNQSIAGSFSPATDNTYSLGTSASDRWMQVFAATGTIQTSDEREKQDISAIPDAVFEAWENVNFVQFKFKDSVAEKGNSARFHTGVLAQKIIQEYQKKGLDATEYGLVCHDEWTAKDWDEVVIDAEEVRGNRTVVIREAYTDESGNQVPAEIVNEEYVVTPQQSHIVHHHIDAGDRWSVRYDELLAMEAACKRWKIAKLEARLSALEAKVN